MENTRHLENKLRRRVLDRDGHQCRYCGTRRGPFHLDHVYPYVKGGETSFENLVTACESCNWAKHTRVGMWPKPLGYFRKRHSPYITIVTLLGIVFLVNGAMLSNDGYEIAGRVVFIAGIAISFLSAGWNLTRS